MEDEIGAGKIILGGIAAVFLVWLVVIICVLLFGTRYTPQAGTVAVVRNGSDAAWVFDWFDNHKIKGVIQEGAGSTWKGLGSEVHPYPAASQQRYFRLQTCHGDNGEEPCNGADDVAITVPSSDGVQVGIEGNFYLNTTFNNSTEGLDSLKKFDTQFGTRLFTGPDGKSHHAWEGVEGWKAALAVLVEPIVANNLREVVASVSCAQLVSSCALVQNSGGNTVVALGHTNNLNNVNYVQEKINKGLQTDLNGTLGGEYFAKVQFRLTHVDLPPKVENAIDEAQASFAQVSNAQASVKKAHLESQANEERQNGYNRCPTCAVIDQIKAIPDSITVWAPGQNSSIAIK